MEFIYIRSSANAMADDLAKQGVDRTSPFVVFQCNLFGGFSIILVYCRFWVVSVFGLVVLYSSHSWLINIFVTDFKKEKEVGMWDRSPCGGTIMIMHHAIWIGCPSRGSS